MPLVSDAVPVYGLDIETDTAAGGLDPSRAAIVAVAVSTAATDVVFQGDESSILTRLDAYLAAIEPGVIATWNGATFDLPFIAHRSALAGIELGLRLRQEVGVPVRDPLPGLEGVYRAAWHQHRHLDGYRLYRADVGRALRVSCGLKSMSRMVGLAPVEVDASRLHLLTSGAIAGYVASDARMTRLLIDRRLPTALASADCLTPSPD